MSQRGVEVQKGPSNLDSWFATSPHIQERSTNLQLLCGALSLLDQRISDPILSSVLSSEGILLCQFASSQFAYKVSPNYYFLGSSFRPTQQHKEFFSNIVIFHPLLNVI